MSRAAWVLLAGACLLALRGQQAAHAGDDSEVVAQSLVKSGRSELARRNYAAAVTLFERALEEAPDLVEAAFWRAQALERSDRPQDALAGYRQYLELCARKAKVGPLGREEESLRDQAQKRVLQLAAAEQELAKLGDAFADALYGFARRHQKKDPAIAAEALRTLLSVRSSEPRATELLAELGGGPAEAAEGPRDEDPFAALGVTEWHDFIDQRSFESKHVTFEDGRMRVDAEGGVLIAPSDDYEAESRCVADLELRVEQEHARGWLTGIYFGRDGGSFIAVVLLRSEVLVLRGVEGGAPEDVAVHPMRPVEDGTWHRLAVRCEGPRLEVRLDGETVVDQDVPGRDDLSGPVGMFHQRCRVEYRAFRVGTLP